MTLNVHVKWILLIFIYYTCIAQENLDFFDTIDINNRINQANVVLHFNYVPCYKIFYLANPERLIIDIVYKSYYFNKGNSLKFNGINLIKCISVGQSDNVYNLRLIFELTDKCELIDILHSKYNAQYHLIFTLEKKSVLHSKNSKVFLYDFYNHVKTYIFNISKSIFFNGCKIIRKCALIVSYKYYSNNYSPIIVAIDAGHGGQDPGAIGPTGLQEKDVTISIARKLQQKLDADKMFRSILTRDGDYFISLSSRLKLAHKSGAHVLISIHTDASLDKKIQGSSVWILSNKRASNEISNRLSKYNDSDKQNNFFGEIDIFLPNIYNDTNLCRTVLDIKFNYSQKVSYEIASSVLYQLKNVSYLRKCNPEYSGFGILCSPDVPSLLVETGFISNFIEEKMLESNAYQENVATALYKGLYNYFIFRPVNNNFLCKYLKNVSF